MWRRRISTIQPHVATAPTKTWSSRRRRPFSILRWFIVGTFSAGTAVYLWNVVVPDRRELTDPAHYYSNVKIRVQTQFPLSLISRLAGTLSTVYVPQWLRAPIYGSYAKIYGCRLDEAAEQSLNAYPTFAAFFNRDLREGIRPISYSLLVSPVDGTVLHFGEMEEERLEFVKGQDYEVHDFLGPINVDTKDGYCLYQVVVYLAPGDYHAFHSPTAWNVLQKVHFPGFLLPVRPANLNRVPKLFCLNERVVLSGQWRHGYFSMSAVAATNVGDIVIVNEPVKNRKIMETESFDVYDERMHFRPGDKVGEFRLGSTVVLIFEAPTDLGFCIQAGDRLRYGQSLTIQPAL